MKLKDNLMKSKPGHYLIVRAFLGRCLVFNRKSHLSGTARLAGERGRMWQPQAAHEADTSPLPSRLGLGLQPWGCGSGGKPLSERTATEGEFKQKIPTPKYVFDTCNQEEENPLRAVGFWGATQNSGWAGEPPLSLSRPHRKGVSPPRHQPT